MPEPASRDASASVEPPPVVESITLWDWDDDGVTLSQGPAPLESPAPSTTPVSPPGETEPVVLESAVLIERARRGRRGAPETDDTPVVAPRPVFRPRIVPGTDLSIFPVVLGGAPFGWTASTEQSMAVLDAYAAAGGNALDTADSYSAGRSEVLIGTWLRERGERERFVLSTKIGRRGDRPGLSAHSMIRATEESLGRLQVETIDVLYFHLDDPVVPLEESLTAADALVRSGKVRYIAASGYRPERMMEARVMAGQLALPRFVGVQIDYNLVSRGAFEAEMSPVARAQELAVLASSSLARGFLGGGYRGRRQRAVAAPSRLTEMAQHMNKRGFRVLDALDSVAGEHGVPSATAALAWLLTKPLITAPVASASTPAQVADLVGAAAVHLTRAQVSALDRASA
ncbi:MAG: aldo/keto reductase [Naasia sp.]